MKTQQQSNWEFNWKFDQDFDQKGKVDEGSIWGFGPNKAIRFGGTKGRMGFNSLEFWVTG